VVSADLVLALSFSKPLPLSSFLSRLWSGTTTGCFAVPKPNFGFIGLPKHQFFPRRGQRLILSQFVVRKKP
jgi:hypothetical protein